MLPKVRLFRRHQRGCNVKYEDTLDKCDCNLGYKGLDPATRKFRRLMFNPPVQDQMKAMRQLVAMERQEPLPAEKELATIRERLRITEAFDRYTDLVKSERNVKESSIYSMWRPVRNTVLQIADGHALKYMDELGFDFIPAVVAVWSGKQKRGGDSLTLNVRMHYRRILSSCERT